MIELMKFDMGGAGATLGAARILGELKVPYALGCSRGVVRERITMSLRTTVRWCIWRGSTHKDHWFTLCLQLAAHSCVARAGCP